MRRIFFIVLLLFMVDRVFPEKHHIRFCGTQGDGSLSYLFVQMGDTIEWKGFFHSYPLRSLLVPEGAQGWCVRSGFVYRYVVKVPGTYYYECDFRKTCNIVGGIVARRPDTLELGAN